MRLRAFVNKIPDGVPVVGAGELEGCCCNDAVQNLTGIEAIENANLSFRTQLCR